MSGLFRILLLMWLMLTRGLFADQQLGQLYELMQAIRNQDGEK